MNIEEFKKVELRVGTILSAERVEGSEKLLKLSVDLGEKEIVSDTSDKSDTSDTSDTSDKSDTSVPKPRQILSGIAKYYSPEQLVGRQAIFVANLDPRPMMGMMSEGMILAVTDAEGKVALLQPERTVPAGEQAH